MIIFTTVLPALVAIAIGVPVWFRAEWFAERMFPAALPDPVDFRRLRAEPLFALALSVMGVLFVCEAVPALVSAAALFTQSWYKRQTVPGPTPINGSSCGIRRPGRMRSGRCLGS